MTKKVIITATDQFIINQVRIERLELNITAEYLSSKVSPSGSPTYIGNIENVNSPATYTDDGLNVIATIFTEEAKTLSNRIYTVYDFYPKHPIADILIIKTKIGIPRESGPTGTINAILETSNYFDEPRTIKEITEHCNSFHNKNWKSTNFTSVLEYAVSKGKLKRIDLPDGGVKYQKA